MSIPLYRKFPDLEALAWAAAEDLVTCIEQSIDQGGRCRMAVSGGSTPRPVYRLVATPAFASRVEWRKVDIFWGDERCVPATDPASNYRMVQEELLAHVPIPQSNVNRIETEHSPDEAARAYAKTLADLPLDLVLLGMGDDGHTASLFPDTPHLGELETRVVATLSPVSPTHRVSLTLRTINEATVVRFWVSGHGKAGQLAEVFRQVESGDPQLPAARVQPRTGQSCWFVDDAAAKEL